MIGIDSGMIQGIFNRFAYDLWRDGVLSAARKNSIVKQKFEELQNSDLDMI